MARRFVLSIAVLAALTSAAPAQTRPLTADLAGVGFLVGTWSSGVGTVVETGGTSTGSSAITVEAGGSVLLRRDHTDLFDAHGTPSGSFEQVMMIYPEGGTLHADYSDGRHVIHYTSAVVVPGHSVAFSTAASASVAAFRLSYELTDPKTLAVRFETEPPGQTAFQPIASGTLQKAAP